MSINMKRLRIFGLAAVALLSAAPVMAQKTMDDMQYLTINENVTTVITASEPVRFVDISTDKVAGDQPISNLVRLKSKEGMEIHHDGDVLAVVTIVTERYRSQYALIYTSRMDEAVTEKTITLDEREPYNNPAVSMSTEDMTRYARQIWASPARVRNVSTKRNRMVMRLNNIYSVGEYFFIDFSVDNRTNIRFDIDQLRVKLNDKKTARSTTVQTIELIPELVLDPTRSFRYGYRNVIVLKKMTFPNDKMLTIELSEQQISGRTISLSIEYEDVLNADSFNNVLLMEN
jgi:conjugative transposon TraN protein